VFSVRYEINMYMHNTDSCQSLKSYNHTVCNADSINADSIPVQRSGLKASVNTVTNMQILAHGRKG
jgi:hypothetical protein